MSDNSEKEILRNAIQQLRQFTTVLATGQRPVNFAKQRSFLTQTIEAVSR